jgi:choline dehydrogenase-like flavoprotein
VARLGNVAPLIGIVADSGGGTVRATRHGKVRIDYRVDRRDAYTLRRAIVAMARIGRAAGSEELVALGTPPAWWRGSGDAGRGGDDFGAYLARLSRFDFAPHRGMVFSAHQMGSARMGASWADHPVDPTGQVRDAGSHSTIGGLYVGDASLFPTAIGVNPMITTMLLARRVSRTVLAEQARGTL